MADSIEHKGTVISLNGDMAKVLIHQASACGACAASGHCMAAESKEKTIDCRITEPLELNDEVMVRVEQRLGWLAIFLAFVMPFIWLMAALVIFGHFFEESVAGTIALCSLLIYFAILSLFRGRLKRTFSFTATKMQQ